MTNWLSKWILIRIDDQRKHHPYPERPPKGTGPKLLSHNEKRDKHIDFAMELKRKWNMKVMLILILTGLHSPVTKVLLNRLEDMEFEWKVETIQTAGLLRSTRIPRKVMEISSDLLLLKIQWKTTS